MSILGTIALTFLLVLILIVAIWIFRKRENLAKFYEEVRGEMLKTVWPSREEVISNTVLVLFCVIVSTVLLWGTDWILGTLVSIIYGT